ncbi:MAG: hypothetical protein II719_05235 [Clostridia bacterium]|nr:hypothetical protein [Clostridia bacterium]
MKSFALGIDTSNYTTSAALCAGDSGHPAGVRIFAQKKRPLPVKEGERGLRQSDALFAHTVALPKVLEELAAEAPRDPDFRIMAVGYSGRPRDLDGSYMPCFLAGESVARGIAAADGIPAYRFSHQAGHIAAAAYSAGDACFWEAPFLAFHLSGGTTDLLSVTPEEDTFRIRMIGTSQDLHAGQLVDRIGVLLGIPFPAGPGLERLAAACGESVPAPKTCVRGCDCNLSGAENQARDLIARGAPPETAAAYVFRFLEKTLCEMTRNALRKSPGMPVLFAGGVMSSRLMRSALSSVCDAHFAEPEFSSDNAAGAAILGFRRWRRENGGED